MAAERISVMVSAGIKTGCFASGISDGGAGTVDAPLVGIYPVRCNRFSVSQDSIVRRHVVHVAPDLRIHTDLVVQTIRVRLADDILASHG